VPGASESTAANASTAGSRPNRSVSRTSGGASAAMLVSVQVVTSRPASAPKKARSTDSVSNWIMTWRRLAPRARRTPISIARPAPRASKRFAILAHAMRSTIPVTLNSMSTGVCASRCMERQRAAQDSRITPELGLPIAVAEHRDVVGAGPLVVGRPEEASESGTQAEGREVGPRDVHPLPRRRLVAIRQTDAEGQMRGESAEYRLRSLEVPERRVAEHHVAASRLPAQHGTGFRERVREVDEPVRVGHRELTKQDLIEEGKDGGIGPDAEREGNDRDAGDERGLE